MFIYIYIYEYMHKYIYMYMMPDAARDHYLGGCRIVGSPGLRASVSSSPYRGISLIRTASL